MQAVLTGALIGGTDRFDLAVLDVPKADKLAALPVAGVNRNITGGEFVEGCWAVGFPAFQEVKRDTAGRSLRESAEVKGEIPPLSGLREDLLSFQVTASPQDLPPAGPLDTSSEWSGMSGAAVFAGSFLVGVVTEHSPGRGPSDVTVTPLAALLDPETAPADSVEWRRRLAIPASLPLLPVPPPPRPKPAYWARLREQIGEPLHNRMPQLRGRDRELAEIVAFATGNEGYRCLVGGAFTGKTALLYESVTVGLPDEVDVVCYFLSRQSSNASSHRFMTAVVPQLAYLCDVDPPVADVEDQYYALWQQAATRAAQSGRHLLLVVDGLDEDLLPAGSPSVASLLPALVGGHAHVLVSSRLPTLPRDLPAGHPLQATTNQQLLARFEGSKELAYLAQQEIDDLLDGPDADLAAEVLGPLAAAAGALSVDDLATLSSNDLPPPSAARARQVRRVVTKAAARSLEPVGSADQPRYQFAHRSLLEYAQTNEDLRDGEYRIRIYRWAEQWRDEGWPTSTNEATSFTPQYLLDNYPGMLAGEWDRNPRSMAGNPDRLAALADDICWVAAAIQAVGVDQVLATLYTAAAHGASADAAGSAVLAVVAAQAQKLRPPRPVDQPGYVLRQLCLQAMELGHTEMADVVRTRQRALPDPGPVPLWTARRPPRALELGTHDRIVRALARLGDGRVVSGGDDRRVLLWDPARPGTMPVELGTHRGPVLAVAGLGNGRVVSGGDDRRVLLWDPARPGADPVELGTHNGAVQAVTELGNGRVVTGGDDWRVLLWDPARPGTMPVELGTHDSRVLAVAVLDDGRVVTGGFDRRVLLWDPARPGHNPVELGAHDDRVGAVAALGDGRVVTGGDDRRVLIWDPAALGSDPVELGRHDLPVLAVAVLADGQVVTGGFDRRVLLWDPVRRGADPVELGTHRGHVEAVIELGDGRVVSGGEDARVLVWEPVRPDADQVPVGMRQEPVLTVAPLDDGRVVTGGAEGQVLVWDPARPGADSVDLGSHRGSVWAAARLGDRAVTGGADGRVLLWDLGRPGADPIKLGTHNGPVLAVASLGDGQVVTGGHDRRVLLWNPARPGHNPVELGTHRGVVWTVAVLSDGRVATGGADQQVLVWDPARPGADPVKLGTHHGPVRAAARLGDGRVLTGGDDGRVLVWDPARAGADPVAPCRHGRRVRGVANLENKQVISGGDDRQVIVSELNTGKRRAEIACSVRALAVHVLPQSGRTLLVVAHQGAGLSIWSVAEAAPR
jgi:WD40 repeat protein